MRDIVALFRDIVALFRREVYLFRKEVFGSHGFRSITLRP